MFRDNKSIGPPGWLLAFSDGPRALLEYASLPVYAGWLLRMPRGHGHPVMVIPGFMGNDRYNAPLLRYLNDLGYHAVGWGLGRNLGPVTLDVEAAIRNMSHLTGQGRRRLSLIGHSLGGIYARELARQRPYMVRQVISLGSPFGEGRDRASNVNRLFQAINRRANNTDDGMLTQAPPVPTTAVYTRGDGVVHWKTTLQSGGHRETENIEVFGSHTGLTLNAAVWYLLAERLADPAGEWRPFERTGWRAALFPPPAWPSTE